MSNIKRELQNYLCRGTIEACMLVTIIPKSAYDDIILEFIRGCGNTLVDFEIFNKQIKFVSRWFRGYRLNVTLNEEEDAVASMELENNVAYTPEIISEEEDEDFESFDIDQMTDEEDIEFEPFDLNQVVDEDDEPDIEPFDLDQIIDADEEDEGGLEPFDLAQIDTEEDEGEDEEFEDCDYCEYEDEDYDLDFDMSG